MDNPFVFTAQIIATLLLITAGHGPGDVPANKEARSDLDGTVNQQLTRIVPAALGGYHRKGDTSTLQRAAGDSTVSSVPTVKATESSPAREVGERKDSNTPSPEWSGVLPPSNVATASKRLHFPASKDSDKTTAPGPEER
ncbi:hypothetical protein MRX96_020409 [Rhipicephalus microplus]